MTKDSINYPFLIDQAMRGVVRDILKRVQVTGLPSPNHFYISYSTLHPQVRMSEQLRAKYPSEITIVIQHQFWDFKVEENQFHVTLSFAGVPEKLTVPFSALTAFADPSIKFGLQFQRMQEFEDENFNVVEKFETENKASFSEDIGDPEEKIISLDAFRKK